MARCGGVGGLIVSQDNYGGGISRFKIWAMALLAGILLVGCAEVRNRGGLSDYLQDRVLFHASAKSHRLLRSYAFATALVIVANNRGIPSGDKAALIGRVTQTMDVVEEGFICAYQSRSGCVFFDEKMSRLDYNIYKLALLVLINSETKELVAELQRKIVPQIPVVGPSIDAATSAGRAIVHATTATAQTLDVVDGLIRLGYDSLETAGILLPLYRDAQELDMRVVMDMLARRCGASLKDKKIVIKKAAKPYAQVIDDYFDKHDYVSTPSCDDFVRAVKAYHWGNGDLRDWRRFTAEMNKIYIADMTPTSEHFVEVSSALLSACQQQFGVTGSSEAGKRNSFHCSDVILFGNRDNKSSELLAAEKSAKDISYRTGEQKPVGLNTAPAPGDKSPKPKVDGVI